LLLDETGRYKEAKPLSQRAVNGAVKVLGKKHPDTKGYIQNLEAIIERLNSDASPDPGER
jgi:hypothetical protein